MTSGDVTTDNAFNFDSRFRSQPSSSLPDQISLKDHNMAAAESPKTDWQITKSSLKERNKHMFNNSLISDVTFSVNNSSAHQQQSALLIPAHKYVLAISSPVFFAMFYGHMADAARTVELADCDYDSFLELLRFVYCDEAELTGSNVTQVLYLAKKYMIPALSEQCTKFLQENLDASNVFVVLPGAQTYGEAALVEQCWETVDQTSEDAMKSEAFLDVSHDLLKAVLQRDSLTSDEVEIFKSVDRWVEHQCDKTERETTGEQKRRIIGDAIRLVRFPLMTQKEFAEVASTTNLLTKEDMCDVLLHFNGVLQTPLSFSDVPRANRKLTRRVKRFRTALPPTIKWSYKQGNPDALGLSVDRDVSLCGLRLFGSQGVQYSVTIGVYEKGSGDVLAQLVNTFDTDKAMTDNYYGFDVIFDKPVAVKKNKTYEIRAVIRGPSSQYTNDGQKWVADKLACFSFSDSDRSTNGTGTKQGQFAEIIYKIYKNNHQPT